MIKGLSSSTRVEIGRFLSAPHHVDRPLDTESYARLIASESLRDVTNVVGADPTDISLLLASDARYFYGLMLSIASVLHHSTGLNNGHIHVLDGGLTRWQKRALMRLVRRSDFAMTLAFHRLDSQQFSTSARMGDSTCTYGRMLAPDVLPELSEILYLDCDVHYGQDVQIMWAVDVRGSAVAAVRDPECPTLSDDCPWIAETSVDASLPYFNAGVLKINLAFWREHGIVARSVALAQSEPEKCRFWDQTILNYLLRNAVIWLPESNNRLQRFAEGADSTEDTLRRVNLHFVGNRKPWLQHSSRPACVMWRRQYATLVSIWPTYMFSLRYWSAFVAEEKMVSSGLGVRIPRFLQTSFIYKQLTRTLNKLRRWQARR